LLAGATAKKGACFTGAGLGQFVIGHAGFTKGKGPPPPFAEKRPPVNVEMVSGDGCLKRLHQVNLLPGEGAVSPSLAAKMAIGGGLGIDRLVEIKMGADAARR